MRCLVVGGTGFLGGAITDDLIENGHDVSIMSRRETQRQTNSAAEIITADRFGDLGALGGRAFDWIFDTCAYSPDAVTSLLNAVGDDIGRYVMISSISAYGTFEKPGLDETQHVPNATEEDLKLAANLPPESRASAFAYGASYGPLKRACEIEAGKLLGDRATALRAGLLVGAGDYSDRLTWWVRRLDEATGERTKVPAPAPKDRPVQLIDARDAARFAVRAASAGLSGIWNVTGQPQSLAGVLNAICDVAGSQAELIWVPENAIQDADIVPWIDVPMMAPIIPSFRHFLHVSTDKARSSGLTCRPLEETLGPLLAWDRSRRDIALKGGMTHEQEARLLTR